MRVGVDILNKGTLYIADQPWRDGACFPHGGPHTRDRPEASLFLEGLNMDKRLKAKWWKVL